jgi:hypothetical protein
MRNATALLTLVVLLGACGGAGPTPTPSPSLDVVVIRIGEVGGMLPPWMTVSSYPSVVVFADGRLIMQGPQMDIYPGPALPSLVVTQLSAAGLAQVLTWAGQAGLVGPDRTLGEPLLDSPVTVFTVVTDAGTHTTTLQGANNDPAVVALMSFQDVLLGVRAYLDAGGVVGEDVPYSWQRMQIVSLPMTVNESPDPQMVTVRDWPLAPLATLGGLLEPSMGYRCAVVEGGDIDALRSALEGANQLTLWTAGEQTYQIAFHPLLPDELGCDL